MFQNGDMRGSIECWELVVKQDPTSSVAWNNLAHCHFSMNNTEKAIELYRRAAQVSVSFLALFVIVVVTFLSCVLFPCSLVLLLSRGPISDFLTSR